MNWQPIETAPTVTEHKPGTRGPIVLLANAEGVWAGRHFPVYISGFRPENQWSPSISPSVLRGRNKCSSLVPTHWMPLPEPPSEGRE